MIKRCKRCGGEFDTGDRIRRVYCDVCRKERDKISHAVSRVWLESVPSYRKAKREASRALVRRARAFESRLLSHEEIEMLNAECDAALARLRSARKAARKKLSEFDLTRSGGVSMFAGRA